MRPVRRGGANKRRSAKLFRKHSHHTKAANMHPGAMRGGIRL